MKKHVGNSKTLKNKSEIYIWGVLEIYSNQFSPTETVPKSSRQFKTNRSKFNPKHIQSSIDSVTSMDFSVPKTVGNFCDTPQKRI